MVWHQNGTVNMSLTALSPQMSSVDDIGAREQLNETLVIKGVHKWLQWNLNT